MVKSDVIGQCVKYARIRVFSDPYTAKNTVTSPNFLA